MIHQLHGPQLASLSPLGAILFSCFIEVSIQDC